MKIFFRVLLVIVFSYPLKADILDETLDWWLVKEEYKHTSLYKQYQRVKESYGPYKKENPYRAIIIESLAETGVIAISIAGIAEVGVVGGMNCIVKNYKVLFTKPINEPIRRVSGYETSIVKSGTVVRHNNIRVVQRNQLFLNNQNNINLMKQGKPPVGTDGEPIQLHHMKQQNKGVIVEVLAKDEHKKEYKRLHRYTNKSEIDRSKFNSFRIAYWKERAKEFQ